MFFSKPKRLPYLKISVLIAVVGLIAIVSFYATATLNIIDEQKKENDKLQTRLNDVSAELKFASAQIENNLNLEFIDDCSRNHAYLTDRDLGLRIDSNEKVITQESLFKAINLEHDSKIMRTGWDPSYFDDDSHFWPKYTIRSSNDAIFVIQNELPHQDRVHTLQILVVIEKANGQFCRQSIRLFVSPEIVLPDNWRVHSILGRGGMGDGSFSLPYGTEFFKGHLWTTDCSNENVSVFDLDGHFKGSFSGFGSGFGELDTPADMKVFNEKIYVVEERNHRVQIFSLDGEPLSVFGSYGEVDNYAHSLDKLNNPLGISVIKDQIVVVDSYNNRIISYDHNFNFLWVAGDESGDPFKWHGAYYIDHSQKHDHFLVSNSSSGEIGIINHAGQKIRAFGNDVLGTAFELAVTKSGDLLVSDTTKFQVVMFDGAKDYAVKKVFPIPEHLGIPKTITSISEGMFAVGIVGNGAAYFLVFEDTSIQDARPKESSSRMSFKFLTQDRVQTSVNQDRSVEKLYSEHCASCHENGKYNAPARGNVEAWDRFSRNQKELLQAAKRGNGAMIPKGGCSSCSEDELSALIQFMLPATWE